MTQGAGTEAHSVQKRPRPSAAFHARLCMCIYIYSFGVEDAVGPSTALALHLSTNDIVTMAGRGSLRMIGLR
jgi:hypothetical protein